MTILVTGASGFVGSRLVESLITGGHVILTIDRNRMLAATSQNYVGDIARSNVLDRIRGPVDTLIHLAADVDVGVGQDCFTDNVYSTFLIAQWAKQNAIRRVIYSSTTGVFAPLTHATVDERSQIAPASQYSMSKFLGETALRASLAPAIILRFSYIYGPGDTKSGLADIIRSVKASEVPTVREEERDYLYVDDVIRAIVAAVGYEGPSNVFNIGTGRLTRMFDIAESVARICGKDIVPLVKGSRRNVATNYSLARRELGWSPEVDLGTGLPRQIESFDIGPG